MYRNFNYRNTIKYQIRKARNIIDYLTIFKVINWSIVKLGSINTLQNVRWK